MDLFRFATKFALRFIQIHECRTRPAIELFKPPFGLVVSVVEILEPACSAVQMDRHGNQQLPYRCQATGEQDGCKHGERSDVHAQTNRSAHDGNQNDRNKRRDNPPAFGGIRK